MEALILLNVLVIFLRWNGSSAASIHMREGSRSMLRVKMGDRAVLNHGGPLPPINEVSSSTVAPEQEQQRQDQTILLIKSPDQLTLSFNDSSWAEFGPTTFPELPMMNLSFPNQSITGIDNHHTKNAPNAAELMMVMMFSLWIVFALAILVFCGCCYFRRHGNNDHFLESNAFDEALQNYVLATFAHAQRISRLIRRKEKLAERTLQKTEMLVTKECFVVDSSLQKKEDTSKKIIEIPRGNDNSKEDKLLSGGTTKLIETQPSIPRDDEEQAEVAEDKQSSLLALSLNLPEYYPESNEKYPNGGPRLVPNSCAICLENFHVGDHLCWSANVSCSHAFHFACIIPWCSKIIKEQPATKCCACPCCRQDFVQFEVDDDEEYCADNDSVPAEPSNQTNEENHPQDNPS